MIKHCVPVLLLLVLIYGRLSAQTNLINNPGFENYISCPDSYNQIWFCDGWTGVPGCMNTTDVADYFHTCSQTPGFFPPSVVSGYQFPHGGNAYCGIITTSLVVSDCNEYCQQQLLDSLIPGTKYSLSFYASLSGTSYFTLASNKLGALFTTYEINNSALFPTQNFAHIYTDTIITDTSGWYFFTGSFIADSAYKYITIGNFFDDAHTLTQSLTSGALYSMYFIDDVYLGVDTALSIKDNLSSEPVLTHYPNPNNGNFTVEFKRPINPGKLHFLITDISGKTVYKSIQDNYTFSDKFTFNLNLESGSYLITVICNNRIFKDKLIVIDY